MPRSSSAQPPSCDGGDIGHGAIWFADSRRSLAASVEKSGLPGTSARAHILIPGLSGAVLVVRRAAAYLLRTSYGHTYTTVSPAIEERPASRETSKRRHGDHSSQRTEQEQRAHPHLPLPRTGRHPRGVRCGAKRAAEGARGAAATAVIGWRHRRWWSRHWSGCVLYPEGPFSPRRPATWSAENVVGNVHARRQVSYSGGGDARRVALRSSRPQPAPRLPRFPCLLQAARKQAFADDDRLGIPFV